MEVINLKSTKVEEKYEGSGIALLKKDQNGVVQDLIYKEGLKHTLTNQDQINLINKGYEFGMCSNYEFIKK